ncbi:hypothetical protein ABFS83_12G131400 [Erythranthe nasuta]
MDSEVGAAEIDRLERGLLLDGGGGSSDSGPARMNNEEEDEDAVVFTASFCEAEESFLKYQTARWILYSLVLIVAWGIGLFMLIYLPVRRYILRKDIRSRLLYLTPNAIVYKVRRPVPFPCFGVLKKEKHILLPSVADVVIEQGYLQSLFGVYSVRIENVGVRRPPSDDFRIQGVANPHAFRKAVLVRLSTIRDEAFSGRVEDIPTPSVGHSSVAFMSPSKSVRRDNVSQLDEVAILRKLEEVGSSVKRVQTLFEEQTLKLPELLLE